MDRLFICFSLNNPGLHEGAPGLCRIKLFLPSLPLEEETLMGPSTLASLGKVLSIVGGTVQRVSQFPASSMMGPGHQETRYVENRLVCPREAVLSATAVARSCPLLVWHKEKALVREVCRAGLTLW